MKLSLSLSFLALTVHYASSMGGSHLVGGYSETRNGNLMTAEQQGYFLNAANKAVTLMNEAVSADSSNSLNPVSLQEIVSVRTQVIAGTKYDMTIKVLIGKNLETCHLLVTNMLNNDIPGGTWSVAAQSADDPCASFAPPKTKHHVTKESAHLLGGEGEAGSEDKEVKKAAQWALEHINSRSNSMFRQTLVKISNVKKQVINGYRYRFQLTTAPSECRNAPENKNKGLEECPVSNYAKAQDCNVSVIRSLEKYKMETFSCKPSPSKAILGGDDHDYLPHGDNKNHILGGDDHDYRPHGLLGGDKPGILGGDDHDYKPHGILGGDDHDYKPHGILGGDDHDYKPHGILGGDDRDYKQHGKINHLLGKDLSDFLPRGRPYYMTKEMMNSLATHDLLQIPKKNGVTTMHILGGDDHDFVPHGENKCTQYKEAFKAFQAKHNKLYGSPREAAKRFMIFCDNMEKVKEYQKADKGTAVYGATKFADISETEFKKLYLGLKSPSNGQETRWPQAEIPEGPVPDSWDWRDHGAVTPVKNQGSCGSCWAFSTTGNVEGQWALINKKLFSLSEQELVDCDKLDDGCNGGLPSQAYDSIMKLGGLETEKDYKYDGYDEKCKFDKSEVVVTLTGAVNISQNEEEIAAWLYKNGPISIGINAFAMQFYMGGIAHPWKIFCNPSELDHGVLIVGYGSESGEPYWIVKNSWGADWGREGYYYVYRGDGTCGLNTMCTSAQVPKQ